MGMFQTTLKYTTKLSMIKGVQFIYCYCIEILLPSSGMTGAYEKATTENLCCQC